MQKKGVLVAQEASPDLWPVFRRSLRIGILAGAIVLVATLPLLFLPSQDDVLDLYRHFVLGQADSPGLIENRDLVRLAVVPFYFISQALGIPDFAVEIAAFIVLPTAIATLAAALFLLVLRRADSLVVGPLALLAGLSPGLFELETFWNARLGLLISTAVLIGFVFAWFARPRWRIPAAFLASLLMMLCYPGALNIALTVYVILAAELVLSNSRPWRAVFWELGFVAAAVVAAALAFALIAAFAASWWGIYPGKFGPLPLPEIGHKAVEIIRLLGVQVSAPPTLAIAAVLFASTGYLLTTLRGPALPRTLMAVGIGLVGLFLVGMQLPSLPLQQNGYPPRTFLFLYLGGAGLLVLATRAAPERGRALVTGAVVAAATIALTMTVSRSGTYLVVRGRDLAAASRFAGLLEEARFDWSRPIAVDFGDWRRWAAAWGPGLTGDLAPLLSQTWASSALVALVADRPFMEPTAEMRADAASACALDRPVAIVPRLEDRGTYLALCL